MAEKMLYFYEYAIAALKNRNCWFKTHSEVSRYMYFHQEIRNELWEKWLIYAKGFEKPEDVRTA